MSNKKEKFDLIFILYQNNPVSTMKYPVLIHNKAAFKTATLSYITEIILVENECPIFLTFKESEINENKNIGTRKLPGIWC